MANVQALAKVTHSATEFGLRQVILQKQEYPLVTMTFSVVQQYNKSCNQFWPADYWQPGLYAPSLEP